MDLRLGTKKYMCFKETRLYIQNLVTISISMVNIITGGSKIESVVLPLEWGMGDVYDNLMERKPAH